MKLGHVRQRGNGRWELRWRARGKLHTVTVGAENERDARMQLGTLAGAPALLQQIKRPRHAAAIEKARATGRSGIKEAVAVLYRHFNDEGALLYVGVSKKGLSRLAQHQSSPWFHEIAVVTLEHFNSYDAALAAEHAAIERENPPYNVSAGTRVNARARIKALADAAPCSPHTNTQHTRARRDDGRIFPMTENTHAQKAKAGASHGTRFQNHTQQ
jgi:hypothetical protein